MNSINSKFKPLFSIVIATLNNYDDLMKCINSINTQTCTDYEVLISDGASVDGTIGLLSSQLIRNLSWFKSDRDEGIYNALNAAFSHARGKWILVLGSDDRLVDNNVLERASLVMSSQAQDVVLVYSDLNIRRFSSVTYKRYPAFEEFCQRYSGAPFIHHQSALIKLEAVKQIGAFNATYKIHADYDLMLRVLRLGSACKINDVFVEYNASGFSSKLKNISKSFFEVFRIRKNLGFRGVTTRIILIYIKLIIYSIWSNIRN